MQKCPKTGKPENRFIETFFAHPLVIVLVIGFLTLFFALALFRAELDNNNIRFVPENDEARLNSKYIDDTFGSSVFILVGLEREGGTIFDPDFLALIRGYVNRIEDIEIVGKVNSIMDSDYIAGEGDTIVVEKLVGEDFSGSREDIAKLKERLLSWDLYRNALYSADFTATQILVPLEIDSEDAGRPEFIEEYMRVRDIAREMFRDEARVYVTGIPVISATISESMRKDLAVLVPLVAAVVLTVLFLSFRRLTAVLLPMLTVAVATVWAMGAMPLFGVKLSVLSTVLPVILVAVGSAYGIHVLTHYLDDRDKSGNLGAEEHRALVFSLLRRIRKPVFLAFITTFAGFFSFCFTQVLPVREWGIFSSFGVLSSFLVAVTLIPSLLLLRGPKPMPVFGRKKSDPVGASRDSPPAGRSEKSPEYLLAGFFVSAVRKKRFILSLSALVLVLAVWGTGKVKIDNVFVEYFKPGTDIARSDRFIREKFGGSKVLNVVMEAESPEILLHPGSLSAMDSLGVFLEKQVAETGKVMGFTDLVKRINQVFNADQSPHGLRAGGGGSIEDGGFGFGDSGDAGFGFGDFGFGDSGLDLPDNGGTLDGTEAAAGNGETGAAGELEKTYRVGELLDLFNSALGEGGLEDWIGNLKRLVNYQGASYYEIPADPGRYGKTSPEELRGIVSNYLILLSGAIDSYSNDPLEPTAVKMVVQLRTTGDEDTGRAVSLIHRYIERHFPKNVKTLVGGSAMVESSLNRLVVQSQLSSVVISLLVVFIIVSLSNRSLLGGLIGVISLSISILINFGLMGYWGIKLNIGTSMVASLSIGIGIDYTIHFMEAYKTEWRLHGGEGNFLRRVFVTTGFAIVINAISVGAGFAVLLLSEFIILKDLGLLIALTMGTSGLVSLTVVPVLLTLLKPKFVGKS
ncbi:MAG: MMPL family transporter [Treponema sp.]|jgi:predicted RND superfamily exporter protein|nr:MMPL family transporter [Treponema sp.]